MKTFLILLTLMCCIFAYTGYVNARETLIERLAQQDCKEPR